MDQQHKKNETIETRGAKVLIGKPGGNAGSGANYYRVGIPPSWAKALGISSDSKDVVLSFDGTRIVIKKADSSY